MLSIFRDDDWFSSACLVLLTVGEDACNVEGGGSSGGGWTSGSSFSLSEECSQDAAYLCVCLYGRGPSITSRNNQ